MSKYVKNGRITLQGKAFENGFAWGMFIAGVMIFLSRLK